MITWDQRQNVMPQRVQKGMTYTLGVMEMFYRSIVAVDFRDVYVCQFIIWCILNWQFIVCQLYCQ